MPEKIETTRFGQFTVNDEDLIRFPKGIPGFETHKKWARAGEDEPHHGRQSLPTATGPARGRPSDVKSNYNARLPDGKSPLLKPRRSRPGPPDVLYIPPAARGHDGQSPGALGDQPQKRIACQVIARTKVRRPHSRPQRHMKIQALKRLRNHRRRRPGA